MAVAEKVKVPEKATVACKICHDQVLDDQVKRLFFLRTSIRDIAAQTGCSRSMVDRHRRLCLSGAMPVATPPKMPERAVERPPLVEAGDLLTWALESAEDYRQYMRWLQDHATTLVAKAAQADNHRMWQMAIKEARENATTLAKASGWIRADEGAHNQILNVFGNVSRDTLLALRDALQPAE